MNAGSHFHGKRVTVVGLGIEGVDLVRFFCSRGATVTVSDSRTAEQLTSRLAAIAGLPVTLSLGANRVEDTLNADLVCVSQGVPLSIPALAVARDRGIPITSMMRLFLELCPGKVIGITGSSGKTTTTSLVGAIFDADGRSHFVGGNIGVGLLTHLDGLTSDTWVILEISHTQLELIGRSPHIACITNVTPNHLDRYTWDEYVDLKARILRFQTPDDYAVVNADNAQARILADSARSRLSLFSGHKPFAGYDGVFLDGDRLIWQRGGTRTPLLAVDDIRLRGAHNVENVAAAAAIATLCDITPDAVRWAVREFRGVPHRLELVGMVDGVAYYNDSIATTPERTLAALRSFAEPIVLLLGGRDKHLPLEELAQESARRCRAVICFGEAGPLLADVVARATVEKGRAAPVLVGTLAEAVAAARRAARPGDIVLLSPACTSFDAYNNFEERGQEFRELVAQEVRPSPR